MKTIIDATGILTRSAAPEDLAIGNFVYLKEKKYQFHRYRQENADWQPRRANFAFNLGPISLHSHDKALQPNLDLRLAALALLNLHNTGVLKLSDLEKMLKTKGNNAEKNTVIAIKNTFAQGNSNELNKIIGRFKNHSPMEILEELSPKWRNHPAIAAKVLEHDSSSWKRLGEEIKKNPVWIRKFIFQNPYNLRYMGPQYRGDKKLIAELIAKSHGKAYIYASKEVKQDEGVFWLALKKNPEIIYGDRSFDDGEIPVKFLNQKKVVLYLLSVKDRPVEIDWRNKVRKKLHAYAADLTQKEWFQGPEGKKTAREFLVLGAGSDMADKFPPEFFKDSEFAFLAVTTGGVPLYLMPEEIIMNPQWVAAVIKKSPILYVQLTRLIKNFTQNDNPEYKKTVISWNQKIKAYLTLYEPLIEKIFLKEDPSLFPYLSDKTKRKPANIIYALNKNTDNYFSLEANEKINPLYYRIILKKPAMAGVLIRENNELKNNREVALKAAQEDTKNLWKHLADSTIIDKDFLQKTFAVYKGMIDRLSDKTPSATKNKLLFYEELLKKYLPLYPELFLEIPDRWRKDGIRQLEFMEISPRIYHYLPPERKKDPIFIRQALAHDGMMLKDMPPENFTGENIELAVKSNGLALTLVPKNKINLKMALLAINNSGKHENLPFIYNHLPDLLKKNQQILTLFLQKGFSPFPSKISAPRRKPKIKEPQKLLTKNHPQKKESLPDKDIAAVADFIVKLLRDEEISPALWRDLNLIRKVVAPSEEVLRILAQAVREGGNGYAAEPLPVRVFLKLPEALRHNPEISKIALEKDGKLLKYLPERFSKDPKYVAIAVKQNVGALIYAKPPASADLNIIRLALKQDYERTFRIIDNHYKWQKKSILRQIPYPAAKQLLTDYAQTNPKKFHSFFRRSTPFNSDPEIAFLFIKQMPFPPRIFDSLVSGAYIWGAIDKKLRKDGDFIFKVFRHFYKPPENDISILRGYLHDDLIKNASFVQRIYDVNPLLLGAQAFTPALMSERFPLLYAHTQRLIKTLQRFKINNFLRLSDPLVLREVIRNRETMLEEDSLREERERQDPRPLAVVIGPRDDFNGEINRIDLKALVKKYRLVYLEAEKAEDIVQLKKATKFKKAELVIIAGHGNQRNLEFSRKKEDIKYHNGKLDLSENQRRLNILNVRRLVTHQFSTTVGPNAKVVLFSCSTGKRHDMNLSLANSVHKLFGGQITLFAPNKDVRADQFVMDKDGTFIQPGWTKEDLLVLPPQNRKK